MNGSVDIYLRGVSSVKLFSIDSIETFRRLNRVKKSLRGNMPPRQEKTLIWRFGVESGFEVVGLFDESTFCPGPGFNKEGLINVRWSRIFDILL